VTNSLARSRCPRVPIYNANGVTVWSAGDTLLVARRCAVDRGPPSSRSQSADSHSRWQTERRSVRSRVSVCTQLTPWHSSPRADKSSPSLRNTKVHHRHHKILSKDYILSQFINPIHSFFLLSPLFNIILQSMLGYHKWDLPLTFLRHRNTSLVRITHTFVSSLTFQGLFHSLYTTWTSEDMSRLKWHWLVLKGQK
jgi:hypothetical protein